MDKWLHLKRIGIYNNNMFSTITNLGDCFFSYDILELKYRLTVNMCWFIRYKRRRENEEMSVLIKETSYYIDTDEINSLPIFMSKLPRNGMEEEEYNELISKYIDENGKVLEAIVNKYKNKLGEKLYSDTQINAIADRVSSYDDFFELEFFDRIKTQIEIEQLKECVIEIY